MMPIAEGRSRRSSCRTSWARWWRVRKPGRTSPEQITVYKSVGIAIQDMAVAGLVYRKALANKIGTEVDLLS